ncbi:MAG: glycosyltransferase family 39 protein [Steroidobacteraceae bacterium]
MTTPVTASRAPLWLVALLCLMAFAFQGTRGIWEPDEGRYSSAGINMHDSGNWLIPTIDGQHPHLTKPPLTYWALATSFAVLGHNEWAARLPSALAYIGSGLLLFGLGRRLCPQQPWLPALVWALSFAPAIAANIVSTDPLLALFETAAMSAFVEAWSREGAAARRWFVLMWLGWGLAFMTKGPPGLLPLFATMLYLGIHDRPRFRSMFVPAGLLLFAVVAFTWFGVVIAQQPDRLGYFLGYEVYDRVFTAVHRRNAQWYGAFEVYVPMLIIGALPWSPLAIVAAGGPAAAWRTFRARLRERNRDWLLLAYWLLLPLAVFFLARSRLQLYVLPLFVPLALMMARAMSGSRQATGRRLAWIAGLTLAALVTLKGVLAYWHTDRDARHIAAQVSTLLQGRAVDRIVFVGMRPYYGLNVYLDIPIEGIQLGERRFEYSKYLSEESLCDEVQDKERDVFAIKALRTAKFDAALAACGAMPAAIGTVFADGNDIRFFVVARATR